MVNRVVIFSNGNLSDFKRAKEIIRQCGDFIICADGSAEHVLKLGYKPQIIIGDFDSLDNNIRKKLQREAIEWYRYPVKKDETDFELALNLAISKKVTEIIIFGILGNRIDHMVANINLLARIKKEKKSVQILIIEGNSESFIADGNVTLKGRIGDIISIIPLGDEVRGITTRGMEYALKRDKLFFGTTRGVSNVLTKPIAQVLISGGVALVVHNRKNEN